MHLSWWLIVMYFSSLYPSRSTWFADPSCCPQISVSWSPSWWLIVTYVFFIFGSGQGHQILGFILTSWDPSTMVFQLMVDCYWYFPSSSPSMTTIYPTIVHMFIEGCLLCNTGLYHHCAWYSHTHPGWRWIVVILFCKSSILISSRRDIIIVIFMLLMFVFLFLVVDMMMMTEESAESTEVCRSLERSRSWGAYERGKMRGWIHQLSIFTHDCLQVHSFALNSLPVNLELSKI